MTDESHTQGEKRFTVVMRGPASVVFWENENLRIAKLPTAIGPVDVTYAMR
jgi:hypothetical protein